MASKIIRTMIVDDHTLFRKGLKLILESDNEIKVIEEAKDGEEALKKAQVFKLDIIIMDINMPILNGLDSLKKMKELGVTSKVIILTAYPKRQNIIAATKLGAKGYLLKDSDPSSLVKAIHEVYIGRSYIDTNVANILTQGNSEELHNNDMENNKIKILSKREYEVLLLIADGLNNKIIGKELFISEKTVKNHITQVFKKLEVQDRVQAALFVYNNSIK